MITPRETAISVNLEAMGDIDPEAGALRIFAAGVIDNAGTFSGDEFVASLVNNADADLTLIPLFSEAPNEISAVRAESGLPEESCHELMRVDLMDPALHGSSALFACESAFLLLKLPHRL